MMAEVRLQVTDAHGRRVVRLDTPRFTIGRRSASDLQVVSTDVSREHAEITSVDGQFVVHDRGSPYGTYVNGEPVTRARAGARRSDPPGPDRRRRAGAPHRRR